MMFALFLLAVLAGVLFSIGHYFRKRKALLTQGLEAEGTIVGRERHEYQLHYCYPLVRFKANEGKSLTLRCKSSGLADDFKIGQRVLVRYAASAPEDFIVVSGLDVLL